MSRQVRLHVQSEDMAGLMAHADLAVGSASSASWERCSLGLPAVVLVTTVNQRMVARELERAGAAKVADFNGLGASVDSMIDDASGRAAMSKRAAVVCDGLGIYRVVSELSPLLVSGASVLLRRATEKDAIRMLDWQRHPAVRLFSRNSNAPTESEHFKWLSRTLADPNCLLTIVEHGKDPVGVVRLDGPNSEGRRQVSIYLDPAIHGRGVGKAALRQLRRLVPHDTFEATVLSANKQSIALFESVGYSQHGAGLYVSEPV